MGDLVHYFTATFTEVFWPFVKPYIDQMLDRDTWSLDYVGNLFNGSESAGFTNSSWVFIGLGIVLVFMIFFTGDDFDSAKGVLFGSAATHRGFLSLLGMITIVNLLSSVYRPIQQLVNNSMFHVATNDIESHIEGIFNPFSIMLLTVVIMHGFMDSGVGAFLFTASSVLFPFVITMTGHTGDQWLIIFLEMIAGGILAAVFSSKRYVYSGYIGFSIFYFVSQILWSVDYIENGINNEGQNIFGLLSSGNVWTEDIPVVLNSMRAEFVTTIIILGIWILFERIVVSSARDVKEALELEGR